jgi:hypothetical protein
MRIFKFRVLFDNAEDVFRDLELSSKASFQDFNDLIIASLGFSGLEMSSFYMSNEDWDKGEEIVLMDMTSETGEQSVKTMADTMLSEMLSEKGEKMLYVYDFMNMKIFYVELLEIGPALPDTDYPRVVLAVGTPPSEDSLDISDEIFQSEYFEDDDDFDEGPEFISTDDLDDY